MFKVTASSVEEYLAFDPAREVDLSRGLSSTLTSERDPARFAPPRCHR